MPPFFEHFKSANPLKEHLSGKCFIGSAGITRTWEIKKNSKFKKTLKRSNSKGVKGDQETKDQNMGILLLDPNVKVICRIGNSGKKLQNVQTVGTNSPFDKKYAGGAP